MQDVSAAFDQMGQGWINLTLRIGDEVYLLDWLSDTGDVVGDVLRATLEIVAGGQRGMAHLEREPMEYRLILERRWESLLQRTIFRIRLLEFPDIYAEAPDAEGHTRFSVACDPLLVGRAIHTAAARLLAVADEKGDLAWWGLPFPFRAFYALEAALERDSPAPRSARPA